MSELLYGRQPVMEVLRAGRRRVRRVILRRGVNPSEELNHITDLASKAGAMVEQADQVWFSRLGADMNHQGAVVEVEGYPYVALEELLGVKLDALGEMASRSRIPAQISSTCVVFAETEKESLDRVK